MQREVTAEFIKFKTSLEDGENPIEKVEVVCSESQCIVNHDIIPSGEQDVLNAAHSSVGWWCWQFDDELSNTTIMEICDVCKVVLNSQTKVTKIEDFQVLKLMQLKNWI